MGPLLEEKAYPRPIPFTFVHDWIKGRPILVPALVLLSLTGFAAMAHAQYTVWSCTADSNVKTIPLIVPVEMPEGNTATAIYIDDRPVGGLGPIPPSVAGIYIPGMGLIGHHGEGTHVYAETDGLEGLQRGGFSALLDLPWIANNDIEICNWGCDAYGGIDPIQGTGCVTHDDMLV